MAKLYEMAEWGTVGDSWVVTARRSLGGSAVRVGRDPRLFDDPGDAGWMEPEQIPRLIFALREAMEWASDNREAGE